MQKVLTDVLSGLQAIKCYKTLEIHPVHGKHITDRQQWALMSVEAELKMCQRSQRHREMPMGIPDGKHTLSLFPALMLG